MFRQTDPKSSSSNKEKDKIKRGHPFFVRIKIKIRSNAPWSH
jgi:hypothetical protein